MPDSESLNHIPRRLIYFPIVHTLADMGGLGKTVLQKNLQKFGLKVLIDKYKSIESIWSYTEQVAEVLPLEWGKVRLYQDGLPVCGREREIVTDLAQAGSRNHQLLLRLIHKGATLMGTESAELLLLEYQIARQALAPEGTVPLSQKSPATQSRGADPLLEHRDQFIAKRINETLLPGEVGILFLGMLHSLEGLLDQDIGVEFPLYQPLSSSRG
ncbi:hypothetical protein [Solidesulfovibrio sp. C21]|uniref:hypothetical protein n=1 Tax=Solidesulfovibrio sp. C21 TaxID=3398613 RepID=UPI0039FD5647